MRFLLSTVMPAATATLGGVALALWLTSSPAADLAARVPGTDRAPGTARVEAAPVKISGTLVRGEGRPADLPGSWPRFRGARFDNVCRDTTPLARRWGEGGPPRLWSIDVGEGHAGAAVLNGRVYILDYDRKHHADALRCLSLADGKEIWRFAYPVKVKRNHGMSRTVPAVTDKHVVGLGPKCHVTCLDARSGELRWMLDLVREFERLGCSRHDQLVGSVRVLEAAQLRELIVGPACHLQRRAERIPPLGERAELPRELVDSFLELPGDRLEVAVVQLSDQIAQLEFLALHLLGRELALHRRWRVLLVRHQPRYLVDVRLDRLELLLVLRGVVSDHLGHDIGAERLLLLLRLAYPGGEHAALFHTGADLLHRLWKGDLRRLWLRWLVYGIFFADETILERLLVLLLLLLRHSMLLSPTSLRGSDRCVAACWKTEKTP